MPEGEKNGKIRLGLIGAGYWGSKLSREYLSLQDTIGSLDLAYISDASHSALSLLKSQLGRNDVRFSLNLNQVLRDDSVSAVHIALPNELHFEVATLALSAGKHVLLEKPMAASSREAFKLATLAEQKGLVLQVGHIFRFNNALRTVKQILSNETLGKPLYANLTWTIHMIPPKNRGIIFDLAPHPIDILNFLLDEWPEGVSAIGESFLRRQSGAEEMAFVNLEFPDSVLAHIYLSWIQHGGKERKVQIVCERGTIDCDALDQTVRVCKNAVSSDSSARYDGDFSQQLRGQFVDMEVHPNNTMRDMELHFIERVRGRGPQFNSALIGAQTVQVLEDITTMMRFKRNFRLQEITSSPLVSKNWPRP